MLASQYPQYPGFPTNDDVSSLHGSFADGRSINNILLSEHSSTAPSTKITGSVHSGILSDEDHVGIRQSDLLPLWGLGYDNPQPTIDPITFANSQINFEGLSLSFLNPAVDQPSQAPPINVDDDIPEEQDTMIQKSWHTYRGHLMPVSIAHDGSEEEHVSDEERHKELAKTLQTRVHSGTLPSTSFLVSMESSTVY